MEARPLEKVNRNLGKFHTCRTNHSSDASEMMFALPHQANPQPAKVLAKSYGNME